MILAVSILALIGGLIWLALMSYGPVRLCPYCGSKDIAELPLDQCYVCNDCEETW